MSWFIGDLKVEKKHVPGLEFNKEPCFESFGALETVLFTDLEMEGSNGFDECPNGMGSQFEGLSHPMMHTGW